MMKAEMILHFLMVCVSVLCWNDFYFSYYYHWVIACVNSVKSVIRIVL